MSPAERAYFQRAYLIILKFPKQFRRGFDDWLYDNIAIQMAFEAEAFAVIATGRTHYSAYTIVEYLRHWTVLRGKSSEFKLDQNWGSSMARMFIHMNPQHAGFMRYKQEPRCILAPLSFV